MPALGLFYRLRGVYKSLGGRLCRGALSRPTPEPTSVAKVAGAPQATLVPPSLLYTPLRLAMMIYVNGLLADGYGVHTKGARVGSSQGRWRALG